MRNVVLSVTFLIFVIVLIIVIFRGRMPYGKENSSFASLPKKEITHIVFTDGNQRLSLEKSDDIWLVNGALEARQTGIIFIEKILTGIRIKSPVATELFDSLIIAKGEVPVKVLVYENKHLLSSFLVYKTNTNIYGNIMKKDAKAKAFINYLPGFEGDIGSAFTLKELFWLPYTVFNLLPSEILFINFEQLADSASSFSITNSNHQYILSSGTSELSGWDSTLVKRYISYFTRIQFESWIFETEAILSHVPDIGSPLYRLTVITDKGEETVLTLWEKRDPLTGEKDTDRLYGKMQGGDEFFILRYFDIDPVIKKRSYFFPELL